MKRAPCRARCPARSRPEECHLREPAEFLGGRCINPALLRALEPCNRAVRSQTCRLRPAHRFSPLSRTEPSCSRRKRLPSLLRAGHHSLLPRAMYFRTSSLAGTARCRPELASQPARVSSEPSFTGAIKTAASSRRDGIRTTRFVCTTSGGYLTECCGDEPDGRSSILSHDAPCDASPGLPFNLAVPSGMPLRPWPVGVDSSSCPER